eukprot:IDg6888t1
MAITRIAQLNCSDSNDLAITDLVTCTAIRCACEPRMTTRGEITVDTTEACRLRQQPTSKRLGSRGCLYGVEPGSASLKRRPSVDIDNLTVRLVFKQSNYNVELKSVVSVRATVNFSKEG